MHDAKLLEKVISEFEALTHIPRPSGHEKAVSDYLKKHFEEIGCTVTQDEHFNIIAELPATKGKENAPRTILQGHMDMVCVAEPGVSYDPLTDPIKMQRTAEYLTADGTSLGGDDGIGVAEILTAMQCTEEHGPLRAIITVDEEQGMTGARHLSADHLKNAQYLINCDSEDYHIMTVGSAGSVNLDYTRALTRKESDLPAYRITAEGLRGGHSGERIGDGRWHRREMWNLFPSRAERRATRSHRRQRQLFARRWMSAALPVCWRRRRNAFMPSTARPIPR